MQKMQPCSSTDLKLRKCCRKFFRVRVSGVAPTKATILALKRDCTAVCFSS